MTYHEMVRIIAPLDAALINLERELAEGLLATPESRAHVERARRRVKLLTEILDNLREFTAEARGPHTSEALLPLVSEAEELALGDLEGAPARRFGSTSSRRSASRPTVRASCRRSSIS